MADKAGPYSLEGRIERAIDEVRCIGEEHAMISYNLTTVEFNVVHRMMTCYCMATQQVQGDIIKDAVKNVLRKYNYVP